MLNATFVHTKHITVPCSLRYKYSMFIYIHGNRHSTVFAMRGDHIRMIKCSLDGLRNDVKSECLGTLLGIEKQFMKYKWVSNWSCQYVDVFKYIKHCSKVQLANATSLQRTLSKLSYLVKCGLKLEVIMYAQMETPDGCKYIMSAICECRKWLEAALSKTECAIGLVEFLYNCMCRYCVVDWVFLTKSVNL